MNEADLHWPVRWPVQDEPRESVSVCDSQYQSVSQSAETQMNLCAAVSTVSFIHHRDRDCSVHLDTVCGCKWVAACVCAHERGRGGVSIVCVCVCPE